MSREQWSANRPRLSLENERVIDVWNFCEGWHPERLLLAIEYFDVDDVDLMVGQLMALREMHDARAKRT